MPFGVREGINIFLAGFIPTENLRFREIGLTFKVAENVDENLDQQKHHCMNSYGDMTKTMQRAGSDSKFILRLQKGSFNDSEIVVLLGENGTGKTTFIRLLAGLIQADDGARVPEMRVSYKPQTVSPKFEGTVRQLLQKKIMDSFIHPQFNTDVIKPLSIEGIIDQEVQHLSGGEIQRVAIILALGAPAEIYLIDEPSAYVFIHYHLITTHSRFHIPVAQIPRCRAASYRRACHQAIHSPHTQVCFHRRARLYHGHLHGGQSCSLRGDAGHRLHGIVTSGPYF
jgi:ATP-binding cassette subfamily E protein 1